MLEGQPVLLSRKAFFASDQAVTMVDRHVVNREIAPHGHDFFEIALAEAGNGSHTSANGEQWLSRGDLVIIRPGAWHGYTRCDGLVIHNCCFDPHLLQGEFGWLREDEAINFLLWTGPYLGDRRGLMIVHLRESSLPEILGHWNALSQAQDLPRRVETLGRLLIMLDSLGRAMEEFDILRQQNRPLHPAVLETMRLLEGQIERAWSLEELAGQSHLNSSYLVRLFKAEVGLAPIAYLNRCRMERAAGLLLHTSLPVAEVAAHVGWFDPNLFARRFRLALGIPPSKYRKLFGKRADDG